MTWSVHGLALHVAVFCLSVSAGDCKQHRLRHIRLLESSSESDVSGPIVKDSDLVKAVGTAGTPPPPPPSNANTTIAALIDKALKHEFSGETAAALAEGAAKSFNATAGNEEGVLETVIRISGKTREAEETGSGGGTNTTGSGDATSEGAKLDPTSSSTWQTLSTGSAVDRIIDNKNNEFVLSRVGSDAVASLLVDPQLIQDITAVLAACAVFGIVFEVIQQPVINGYLVAGAVLGPGGAEVVRELVQVESLAQVGVQLLLFNLGLEMSMSKLRAVYGVAVFGGCAQILLSMLLTGSLAAFGGVSVSQGVFIGALLSMSSTSVVVKCLETTRSTNNVYGQITIGTLILQDCCVGLMFALLPVFRPQTDATLLAAAEPAENRALIIVMVLQVLFKLAAALALAVMVSKTVLVVLLRLLYRYGSSELVQLSLVAFCLSSSWVSHHYGISSELGAFIAGAMVSHSFSAGVATSPAVGGASSLGGSLAAGARSAHGSSVDGGSHHIEPHHLIESLHNVMTALFVASIGLMMSPTFLWDHLLILTAGTVCVVVVKSLLVTCVVRAFGIGLRTSFTVGITLAHVGEFSLVLLSMAMQLKILATEVYMLLLGVTALSLLSTPMVIMVTHGLLRDRPDSHATLGKHGLAGGGGGGLPRHSGASNINGGTNPVGGSPDHNRSGSDSKLLAGELGAMAIGHGGGGGDAATGIGADDVDEVPAPQWLDGDAWRRKAPARGGRQPA